MVIFVINVIIKMTKREGEYISYFNNGNICNKCYYKDG